MTNFEYYKNEIMELAEQGKALAVVDGKPMACFDATCGNCDLEDAHCEVNLIKWLYSEHRSLTDNDITMCHAVDPDTYIYRSGSGNLYLSSSENLQNLCTIDGTTAIFFDNAIKIDARLFGCIKIGEYIQVGKLLHGGKVKR